MPGSEDKSDEAALHSGRATQCPLCALGTSPAMTMALHRIADSCTKSITPMSTSFMLCVGHLQTLRRKAGIGTPTPFTLPIAMIVRVVWVAAPLELRDRLLSWCVRHRLATDVSRRLGHDVLATVAG
ncbi:AbgT family transporter [Streptomyces tuirus]|uniref:AbgT family transporter n=1 Tax=Streptomyces tuirus TaxID=68278 RepID=UPI00344A5117